MQDHTEEFFGSMTFKGERFAKANLPVAVLKNIKAYQDLLLHLAEEIWRERNPERKRTPKNFRRNLSLSFSHVEDGSAAAYLKPDRSIQTGLLPDEFSLNYLALAQSRFFEVSRAANENRAIDGVPGTARKALNQLLTDIRAAEAVEFASYTGKDARHPRVRYSEKTRDRILESTTNVRPKPLEGIGIVRSIFDASEEIELLSAYGKFRCKVDQKELRANSYPIAALCSFSVTAVLHANGNIKSIVSSNNLSVADLGHEHNRIARKLEHFSSLPEGWKNGQGSKISLKALMFANDIAGFICRSNVDVSVFPQIDGSITFEFSAGDIEIEVECRKESIRLEVFDKDMEPLLEQVFFGLSPKLLSTISHLNEVIA